MGNRVRPASVLRLAQASSAPGPLPQRLGLLLGNREDEQLQAAAIQLQQVIDKILLIRLCLYRDMKEAEVLLHSDRAFAALELPASHANEAVSEERLKAKRRRRGKRTQDARILTAPLKPERELAALNLLESSCREGCCWRNLTPMFSINRATASAFPISYHPDNAIPIRKWIRVVIHSSQLLALTN
jgi:hypothetical protein